METQKNQNPGLFSAIFHLISSFVMTYVYIVFLALMIAFAISQAQGELFFSVQYYLIMITSFWFLIYGILMFFKQFAYNKGLSITNLILIILNIVGFVMVCVLLGGESLGELFRALWIYVAILIVGLISTISLLKKIKNKPNQPIQPNSQPNANQNVYTADGNSGNIYRNDNNDNQFGY